LLADGYHVRQILPGPEVRKVSASIYEAPLDQAEGVAELHRLLATSEQAPVGGLINFLCLTEPYHRPGIPDAALSLKLTLSLFHLLKEFSDELTKSAEQGGGWVLNLTSLNGKLGVHGGDRMALAGAGTLGLCKTFRQEYPKVSIKTVDIDPALPAAAVAAQLADELAYADHLVEVGIHVQGRFTTELHREEPHRSQMQPLPLNKNSVVLVTGGADGITAEVALGLARAVPCRLILVGRSPLPPEEPAETRGLSAGELRQHLIQQSRASGKPLLPAQIERALKQRLKERRIRQYLQAMESAGASVEYHSVDVRNASSFGGLIDRLYEQYGAIDGVLHGAGVIEDKLIRDKTPESYANVYSTKVESAVILARKLRPESLKFCIFFSSIAGRFGNAGQSDYSAANEFLNKLAQELDRRWPGRVSAVNWGPWDAGMVSDELRKIYASREMSLIPVLDGVARLEQELRLNGQARPEVLISCSVPRMQHAFSRAGL
jgi:NAD(P)-dependent dehydrogenase (short-subunit alcohol dehydrogenase family)